MDKIYTKEGFKEDITSKLTHILGVTPQEASDEQFYKAIAILCKDRLAQNFYDFRKDVYQDGDTKTVYYLCMEFLLGRSLKNNLYNLNLTSVAEEALEDFGIKLDNLYECEPDAGLGNGGLGRLAACYLDGLATGGYSSYGYGILYEYGIFKQKIVDGWQTELPDFWLPGGDVWLTPHSDQKITVNFGGELKSGWQDGYYVSEVLSPTSVVAVPYDMYISGKDKDSVSVLRLWKAEAPGFDMKLFNDGDYMRAIEKQATAEAICKVLYPSDNHTEGKMLRLRQQYFLVSASVQDIVRRHLHHYKSIDSIPQKMAVHINDTHPTLAIPELMRICMDECGYSWDDAWKLVSQTFAYTNHTVMKEALECWLEDIFRLLMPRIYQIVAEIDNRYRAFVWDVTHDASRVEDMAIISNGAIRMANLCVATCHSVNGVSALHSEILKDTVFNNFYQITPNKFKNVTNGIAYRRWLCQANPELTDYITELIGPDFIHDGSKLEGLKKYKDDTTVLDRIGEIKQSNKDRFCDFIKEDQGIILNPNSLFDVQVKRLHEYKRQHLNVYEIIHNYLMLKDNPNMEFQPRTYIFGSKAASGYYMAKKIISLIVNLSKVVNNDPDVRDRIKIAFIEDYRVSMAEHLMPAADVSEQISLAGTEASGTGNMKLMIDGAVTLGTMDGANVEIHDAVGADNIFIFGMDAKEVEELQPKYNPSDYFMNNEDIKRVVEFINKGVNGNYFPELAGGLINNDPYMVLADYADYQRVRESMVDLYAADQRRWNQMALIQTASAGIFSADRAIAEYAENIWHTRPVKD